ncbi:MAG: DNA adenine methylase [Akkermansiaceae bacterium]|nr:DNA adenine methylase [Akkermansiaceae bacterium]
MAEDEEVFYQSQLITYLGNKRKLLPFIRRGVEQVRARLGERPLRCYDAFAGSGVVSRLLKAYASELYSNDLESYAAVLGRCYLTNRSELPELHLAEQHTALLERVAQEWAPGLIAELYAPADDACIRPGERAFYTRRNAIYLDTARRLIAELPEHLQPYFLAPLLYEASVHTNTGGVFKGFYKNAAGVGQFGGRGRQALERIMADIRLPLPVFSAHECRYTVLQGDATASARLLPELDLAYLDPPYNQHPYGSNYFMLNLLAEYKRPEKVSAVSGIPQGWNRSAFNTRAGVADALRQLLSALPCSFVLLSYNSEGLLSRQEICALAQPEWRVHVLEQEYPTYKASRNLRARSLHVQEYLFVMERR